SDAVFALLRHPAGDSYGGERAIAQGVRRSYARMFIPLNEFRRNRLVHRNEPLRRIAEDHRLLRAPGVRVLVLESAAGDEHTGIDQGLDDRVVGIALLAL